MLLCSYRKKKTGSVFRTCNQGAIEIRYIFLNSTTGNIVGTLCKTSNSLYTVLFLNERGKS